MAKAREEPSTMSIFKQYFTSHPEWLTAPNNDAVMAQFAKDHPNRNAQKAKGTMANVKSLMKKAKGLKGRRKRRKGGRPAAAEAAVATRAARTTSVSALESFEEQLDDCLAQAKGYQDERLADVIKHLRRARNNLVVVIEG